MMDYTTTVTVLRMGVDCRDDRLPQTLDDAIEVLTRARERIPVEFRHTASFDCSPTYEFGEHYDALRVTYERPETPTERLARLAGRKAEIEKIAEGHRRWLADRQEELSDIATALEAAPGAVSNVVDDPCPDCGKQLVAQMSGGVKCTRPGCGYWFCY